MVAHVERADSVLRGKFSDATLLRRGVGASLREPMETTMQITKQLSDEQSQQDAASGGGNVTHLSAAAIGNFESATTLSDILGGNVARLGAFSTEASIAGQMVQTFGEGSVAADGDGGTAWDLAKSAFAGAGMWAGGAINAGGSAAGNAVKGAGEFAGGGVSEGAAMLGSEFANEASFVGNGVSGAGVITNAAGNGLNNTGLQNASTDLKQCGAMHHSWRNRCRHCDHRPGSGRRRRNEFRGLADRRRRHRLFPICRQRRPKPVRRRRSGVRLGHLHIKLPQSTSAAANPGRASSARAHPIREPAVAGAIRHAVERGIAAEAEIGLARSRDRPAAGILREFEQRAGVAVVDRLVLDHRLRFRGERLQQDLPQLMRAARRPLYTRLFLLAGAHDALVAGQVKAGDLADHGVAADADLVGDLAAGEAGGKMEFQGLDAIVGPGLND